MSKESLQQAVDLAGGQAQLARGIKERMPGSKVGQVHVWGWLNSVKIEVPPADVVLAIADFLEYRMTPHELRPDLYPNPGDALPAHVAPAAPCTCASSFGGLGEPRDGDRRQEDRRRDGSEAAA